MRFSLYHWICIIGCVLFGHSLYGQSTATLYGRVTDNISGRAIDVATVYIKGTTNAVETDRKGRFELTVEAGVDLELVATRVGYVEASTTLGPLPSGSRKEVNVKLASMDTGVEVIVTESRIEEGGMIKEELSEFKMLPTTTGNLESLLPSIALGVSSGTGGELSSQYNVRGGNYDENLVYVNDFEIYRPQLIRAGQQEGLTFPNMDLTQSIYFSSGGFEAKYGDRLSSVLDIRYKRPDSLKASFNASFLGGRAHLEGSIPVKKSDYRRFRYLIGTRYKTTRYLLGSLDVTGEYNPNFTDIQGYFTYDINRDWQIAVLANYNRAIYNFIPASRSTALGLIDFALELFTVFEGQERDDFTTSLGGVSLTYLPDRVSNPFFMKFLASRFESLENERFDIIGDYSLRQIESNLGSDDFGEVLAELGTGTRHEYVRNFFNAVVTNVEHKGGFEYEVDVKDTEVESSHFIQWSVKYQNESIDDQINEWERLDSAGYSLQYDTSEVLLNTVLKTRNQLQSNRVMASLQDTYTWQKDGVGEFKASAGIRAAYWDLNQEFFVTPRAQLLYKPLRKGQDISYRLAGGLYYQPPFYRELRRLNGTVNTGVLAQKSAHIVAGFTWDFNLKTLSKKKFRFITEAYYKQLWDIVSYEIENVRIRYSGENDATGYVTGIDFRVNGEFVPGAESWINLSFLRARERLNGVQHAVRDIGNPEGENVADAPRPTDQLMSLSMFFQDYLPKNE
ncbi:MAG: carboxypeptidase-like regulatory domain-containing protein, partial [Bacteroidota bacterium]